MKPTKPTPSQIAWLKENFRLYNNCHLAEKLDIPVTRLTLWLKDLNLRKRDERRRLGVVQPNKKVNLGPEKTIKRSKADHTNVSREQHVERILKMEI